MISRRDFSLILQQSGLHHPVVLTLSITDCCNLECHHCFVDAGRSPCHGNVNAAVLRRLVREFAAIGGTGVRITGGEPLCHPEWLELIRLAREVNLESISLQTNGILLSDGDVAALHDMDFPGLSIQVSLDGASAESHDLVRGKGAFIGALDGIQRLVQGGLADRVALHFTEMRHNLHEFPALLELAESISIREVVAGTVVPFGRARDDQSILPPEPEQYMALLNRYETDQEFQKRYSRIGTAAVLEWNLNSPRSECCTFVENPYITPDGKLYPCVLCHSESFSVSDVFEKSLEAAFVEGVLLWSGLQEISNARSSAIKDCMECPGKDACAGGCMGRAWASCGEFMFPDDRCRVRKSVYLRSISRVVNR